MCVRDRNGLCYHGNLDLVGGDGSINQTFSVCVYLATITLVLIKLRHSDVSGAEWVYSTYMYCMYTAQQISYSLNVGGWVRR